MSENLDPKYKQGEIKPKKKNFFQTIWFRIIALVLLIILDVVAIYSCSVAKEYHSMTNITTPVIHPKQHVLFDDSSNTNVVGDDITYSQGDVIYFNVPANGTQFNFTYITACNGSTNNVYDGSSQVGLFTIDNLIIRLHVIKSNQYNYTLYLTYGSGDDIKTFPWFTYTTANNSVVISSSFVGYNYILNGDWNSAEFDSMETGVTTTNYSFLELISLPYSYSSYSNIKYQTLNKIVPSEYYGGYQDGYNDGLHDGATSGYNQGYTDGSNEVQANYIEGASGYQAIYNTGYNDGLDEASPDSLDNAFKTTASLIFNSPYTILHNVFNFEFLGINIFALISFLITCAFILFVLKLIWR